MQSCLLCKKLTAHIKETINEITFIQCDTCSIIYKDPKHFVAAVVERNRYLKHTNDVDDAGYQSFVLPLVGAIKDRQESSDIGLDFGAGTGPVAGKMLAERGFKTIPYDPFFHPNPITLKKTYDYIFCCEVIEHFYDPRKEFKTLKGLLKPGGTLYCMTELVPQTKSLVDWYYKNDYTHVVFYTEKSLRWIAKEFRFSEVLINDRLVIFNTSD